MNAYHFGFAKMAIPFEEPSASVNPFLIVRFL